MATTHFKVKQLIQGIDAGIDGGYLYGSMDDYAMDMHFISPDKFEATPLYIITLIGIVSLTTISILSRVSWFEAEEEKQQWQQKHKSLILMLAYMNESWPYFRDMLSGIKNGRHAYVSATTIAVKLAHCSIHYVNPVGAAIGVFLAIILVAHRQRKNIRKTSTENNLDYAEDITSDSAIISNAILIPKKYSNFNKGLFYSAAIIDGFTDGLYLFGCVTAMALLVKVNLLTFGVPLILAAVCAGILALVSTMVKVQDEHEAQKKHDASVEAVKRAKLIKKLQEKGFNDEQIQEKLDHYDRLQLVSKGWKTGRELLCCVKNAHSAIVTWSSLIIRTSVKAIGFAIGITIAGFALGIMYFGMMLFGKNKTKPKLRSATAVKSNPINLESSVSAEDYSDLQTKQKIHDPISERADYHAEKTAPHKWKLLADNEDLTSAGEARLKSSIKIVSLYAKQGIHQHSKNRKQNKIVENCRTSYYTKLGVIPVMS